MLPTNQCSNLKWKVETYQKSYDSAISTKKPASIVSLIKDTLDQARQAYKENGCGQDLAMDECLGFSKEITDLQNSIDYAYKTGDVQHGQDLSQRLADLKNKFNDKQCEKKINEYYAKSSSEVVEKYSGMDEARIEAENKYTARMRVFYGAVGIVGALFVITLLMSRK